MHEAPRRLLIHYTDSKGVRSVRTVRVYALTEQHLHGGCEVAGARRTFLLDRVSRVIDADTGEILKWH